jgi:cysteine desulfurase/selenocysteine lyase
MDLLTSLTGNEQNRRHAFPICREKIFMAHAAVTALPRVVADAVIRYAEESAANFEDFAALLKSIQETRLSSA